MTYNEHYERFASILSTIEENGISTADELKHFKNKALWNELYFATQNFVNYYALASKTSKNKKGEVIPGNMDKVKFLIEKSGKDLYDIQMDILTHIIDKIDYVLAQSPISKKTNYAYRIVNNEVNNMLRKLPPVELVPIDIPIKSDTNKDGAVLADIIEDHTYNPDCVIYKKETIAEFTIMLKAKQAKELTEKKEAILREVPQLNNRPAEVMAKLALTYLDMKPRHVADLILEKGCELAFAEILFKVAKRYSIELSEIRSIIAGNKVTDASLKANTNSRKQVADEVGRLKNRADKHLK